MNELTLKTKPKLNSKPNHKYNPTIFHTGRGL